MFALSIFTFHPHFTKKQELLLKRNIKNLKIIIIIISSVLLEIFILLFRIEKKEQNKTKNNQTKKSLVKKNI